MSSGNLTKEDRLTLKHEKLIVRGLVKGEKEETRYKSKPKIKSCYFSRTFVGFKS